MKLPAARPQPQLVWVVLALLTIGAYGYMLYVTGLSLRFMSLTAVQSTRFEYRDAIASSGPTLAYLIGMQGNVVNPLLMAYGVLRRRAWLAATGILGQLLIFSATGYKMMILSVPTVIVIALVLRSDAPRALIVTTGVSIAGAAALLADRIAQTHEMTLIFIGRLALIPGALTAAHVMVFEGQPKAQWGHSVLAGLVEYPYSMSPAMLVGAEFSGSSQTTANASFLGEGYANLGYAGVLIEALVLLGLLALFDAAADGLSLRLVAPVLLVPALSLVNTSVFTSLLTGGCLFAALVLWTLPRDRHIPVRGRSARMEAPV